MAFPGSMALEGIDVVAEHEHDEVSKCFFVQHPDIQTRTKHFGPVVPVVPVVPRHIM